MSDIGDFWTDDNREIDDLADDPDRAEDSPDNVVSGSDADDRSFDLDPDAYADSDSDGDDRY